MAANLLKAGYKVTGYDVDSGQIDALVKIGGNRAGSCREVAEQADVVITSLPSGEALQQVAEGVVIVDLEGHFLFANEAAQRIVGMGPVDAPPADWSSLYGCFLPDRVTPFGLRSPWGDIG